MKRRYDYRCLECRSIIEQRHGINDICDRAYCPICRKEVCIEKLISKTNFKIGWDTNY